MAMLDYQTPPVPNRQFQPATANWRDPKDLGRCVQWMWGQRGLKDALEARTARNIAFLEGRQHEEWHWRDRQMRLPAEKRDKTLMQYNIIKILVNQKLAKLGRYEPVWSVPAYTSDEYDQVVARFSNDVMRYYWDVGLEMSSKVSDLLLWMFVSPIAFLHCFWNPIKGDPVEVTFEDFARPIPADATPEMATAMLTEDQQAFERLHGYNTTTGTVVQYTGDIDVEVVDVFRVMWYPFYASRWDDVRIVLKSDIMPVEDVVRRYGIPADEVLRLGKSDPNDSSYNQLLRSWANPLMEVPEDVRAPSDSVLVHKLFVGPELAGPGGASAVVIGNSPEAQVWGELGNKFAEMPFRPVVESRTPGRLWGTCTVDDLILPSIDLNLSKTQQAEWRNTMLRPRIVRIKGDGADDLAFKADAQDAVIEVNDDQHKPSVLYMPSSGIEHESAVAFDMRFMHDSAAVPDVSLGNTSETNAKSGVAVRSLQEEANERLRIPGRALDGVFSWSGRFLLGELQDKAVRKRVTPLVGENNSIEYLTWSRALLRPTIYAQQTAQTAIVKVSAFSNIPTTPVEVRNTLVSLAQLGFLVPGVHDRVVANAFGMDDLRTHLDKGRADRDRQEREIEIWRKGGLVGLPALTDDHAIHEEVLASWIKSEEFASLTRMYPLTAQDVMQHYEAHQQGKFDDLVRVEYRTAYARMRVGAEFAARAATEAGVPAWAQLFLAQSMGGMAGTQPGIPGDPNASPSQGGAGAGNPASAPPGSGGERPDQALARKGIGAPGQSGRPGERVGGDDGSPSGANATSAADYGRYGDAAGFRSRIGPGKDGAGSPGSMM